MLSRENSASVNWCMVQGDLPTEATIYADFVEGVKDPIRVSRSSYA